MNLFFCVLLFYTCLYFVTAGQAIFYKLCFAEVFMKIPSSGFIAIRKLADPILELKLKVVYFGGLFAGTVLCVICIDQTLMYQVASMTSFVLFLTDIVLAKKFSMPLNEKIRLISTEDHAAGRRLQKDWIRWIRIRGNIALTGFAIILITVIIS